MAAEATAARYPPNMMAPTASPFASLRSSEGRLSELESAIGKAVAMRGNAILELRKALDSSVDAAIDKAASELDQRDRELREILEEVLAGSIRDRQIGAALLAAGIVFAVTGSVIGTLA